MKLINDDCLKVLPTLPDQSVDLILADPPYGTTQCKWDSTIPFEPMWKELKRIIKDNGCIALFGTEPFSSYLRVSNTKWYKYDWVWNKNSSTGFMNAKLRPMNTIEINLIKKIVSIEKILLLQIKVVIFKNIQIILKTI